MKRSLIDAGPVIALFDRNDAFHLQVVNYLKTYEGRLITTWSVLTEVSYMLDFNNRVRLDFLSWVFEGGMQVVNLDQDQLGRIREIMETYSDLPADFADATLLTVAESMNIENILTIDRDFSIYRLKDGSVLKPLF